MGEIINNNPLRLSNRKTDKILLKENKLIYSKFYLFGCFASHEMFELRHKVINGLNQAKMNYKIIYSGVAINVKPYQLQRIIDKAQDRNGYAGTDYKNYLEPDKRYGLKVKESYLTALKAYELKYLYFPYHCLIVQVQVVQE